MKQIPALALTALLLAPLATLHAVAAAKPTSPLLQTHELKSNSGVIPAVVNCVTELAFTTVELATSVEVPVP